MKKFTRILSAALVAMMVLSLVAVASAETPSVYIPNRVAKLVDIELEDYDYPTLVTKGDTKGSGYNVKLNTEGVMHFQFSEKPDWAGAVVSSLDGGWINLDVDESGYAEMELEDLHRQPGMWSWSSLYFVDKDGNWHSTGRSPSNPDIVEKHYSTPDGKTVVTRAKKTNEDGSYYVMYYGNGGDYAYSAGKDYGDYSVEVSYHRDGSPYKVALTLKDVDLFETGMEGATSTVTFELVNVQLSSVAELRDYEVVGEEIEVTKIKPNNKFIKKNVDNQGNIYYTYEGIDYYDYDLANTDMWYKSAVSATYPEGNYIVGVEADYKNDAKNNLSQYKISYAVSEDDVAQVYYKPWDTPFYGLYYKKDAIYAVSGSGNNLNKWYKYNGTKGDPTVLKKYEKNDDGTYSVVGIKVVPKLNNNGKQIKSIKKGINTYKSPRVTTK